jgi:Double zinc ribbon
MRCPRCDADTPDGTKFCIECGTSLALRCPRCGADVLPRAKFCGECGTPLTAQAPAPPAALPASPLQYTPGYLAEKILTAKTTLEGERKHVTVLFADLKGSLELLADRDPEDARQLLDPVLTLMMDAVHRYEGTVNQVLGDGIWRCLGPRSPMKITPCGRVMRRSRCKTPFAVTVRRCVARTASKSTSGWA